MESHSRFGQWMRRRVRAGKHGREDAAADEARERTRLLLGAAASGFPLALAAHPEGYGCSCVRIGCPTPGRHPVSFGWQTQATADAGRVERWAAQEPLANFVTPTGRVHDVLDVPVEAGRAALRRLEREGVALGPVALSGGERMLFFTATRTPEDEDEWWPCELDCHPETKEEHPGLRWHTRGSYVLLPPAKLATAHADEADNEVRWLREPEPGGALPEPLTLLEALTDACAAHSVEETAAWPVR
ncbi:bifunctional DNA primase/polymerase [Streptomyces sulphureus]|uniref:bifunctional DNA primase/polymerase n=3 Tax=Streptomyces TaxID=1883 RepID=UPI00036E9356|nr:bifunctional DNA primase/polymerase [Streptomyces sulphureus]